MSHTNTSVDTPDPSELEKKLPFMSHLEEARKRLLKSLIAVIVTTIISSVFARHIFNILKSRVPGIELIYIEMTEMISAYFRVAFISGIILASPFLIYQFIMFIRPGLTATERRYLYIFLPSVLLPFAVGVAFAYFVLIPPALKFLVTFGSDIATPQIRVGNYVSLITRLLFAIGLCFEAPPLIFFLAKIGIVTPLMLSKYRRVAIVGAFILSAIITPTFDPVNQTVVALPLIVLYEIGIGMARLARRKGKSTT